MRPLFLAILLSIPACRAPASDVGPVEPAPHTGHPAECVGCLVRPEGVVEATAYRFAVEVWELPLEQAEALYRRGDPVSSSLALLIDDRDVGGRLREAAARDPRVERFERPEFAALAGARALMPARASSGERRWSDGVRLELGGAPTPGWAPDALEFACTWTSPQGEALGQASGATPLPYGHGVVLWCLPAGQLAEQPEPRTARAVVALVRVTPTSG